MSHKLGSVVAVLAFLSLSTAGTVQARPVATPLAGSSGLLGGIFHWMSSEMPITAKAGGEMDPNGNKSRVNRVKGAHEASPGRAAARER